MSHSLQPPLPMRFSRQKYWSRGPFPTSDLPDPGIEATFLSSPALSERFFTTGPRGNHQCGWGSSNQSAQNKTDLTWARKNSNWQPLDLSCSIGSSWVCSLQMLDLPTSIIMWAIPKISLYIHTQIDCFSGEPNTRLELWLGFRLKLGLILGQG